MDIGSPTIGHSLRMAQPNRNDLTERHLALHQESYASVRTTELIHIYSLTRNKDPKLQTTWAEQVVREENIQAFHSQSGMLHASRSGSLPQTGKPLHQPNQAADEQASGPQQLDNSLKLFSLAEKENIDDPVQRFLTPGSSDPPLFAKPALNALNISFGSMETVETREQMARANVDAVRENRKNHKGGKIQRKIDEDTSSMK